MYYSVTKIGSEYFTLHEFINNKGDRAGRLIRAAVYLTPQIDTLPLIIRFEGKGIVRITLLATTLEVSLKDIFELDTSVLFGWEESRLLYVIRIVAHSLVFLLVGFIKEARTRTHANKKHCLFSPFLCCPFSLYCFHPVPCFPLFSIVGTKPAY